MKPMENGKSGIVIEGGGHRGIYAAGALDALMEGGVAADGVIGVSAGAVYGVNYRSGQAGRVIRYTRKFCADPHYMGLRSFIRTGDFFNVDFCYKQIPRSLDPFDDDAFDSSPMEFFAVATDVETGEPICHRFETLRAREMDWLQGSASMPLASKIVRAEDGHLLLDGGVADSLPLNAFENLGFTRNVVILTQCAGYRKKKNAFLPLIRIFYRRYPRFVRALAVRHLVYNRALEDIERKGEEKKIVLLRPSKDLGVSRTERDARKITALYDLGRADAAAKMSEIKEFLR